MPVRVPENLEDGDLAVEDLKQPWPEEDNELRRLKILLPTEDDELGESAPDHELAALNSSASTKKRKAPASAQPRKEPALDLRAVRTRSGQVRKEVTRLSSTTKTRTACLCCTTATDKF